MEFLESVGGWKRSSVKVRMSPDLGSGLCVVVVVVVNDCSIDATSSLVSVVAVVHSLSLAAVALARPPPLPFPECARSNVVLPQ